MLWYNLPISTYAEQTSEYSPSWYHCSSQTQEKVSFWDLIDSDTPNANLPHGFLDQD